MPREAAGRGQHFQDRFLIPRKVITGQIPCQITRHVTRQIIKIIISRGFMGTVAISYQVAITFSRKANLRLSQEGSWLSLQHFYSRVALSRNKKIIRKPFSV